MDEMNILPEPDYDAHIARQEQGFWRNYDNAEAEREEQEWFDENEYPAMHEPEPCPNCGATAGFEYEPHEYRDCGCVDTAMMTCESCGKMIGLAQYDGCGCAEEDDWDDYDHVWDNEAYDYTEGDIGQDGEI